MKNIAKICIIFLSILSLGMTTFADDSLISKDSTIESIQKLQTVLSAVGAYDWDVDWEYESVRATIIKLQIELAIISSENDEKAGTVDGTFLNRVISVYKETPERQAELAEKKALEEAIAREAENKAKNDAAISTAKQQELVKAASVEPDTGERKFIVTAYYSPLPGQKRYSTGSYSGDIRLNGEGTHGASGAWVYFGFIAAPKNYPFGTKIYLEWFGNGVVEDRWWAIVNAWKRGHEYDRLDIWMWYGDTGLTKALNWGKRTVNWKILWDGAIVVDGFNNSWSSEYFDLRVTPSSEWNDVKKLQELLQKLDYYNGSIDGSYKSVEQSLISYQLDKKIIVNASSDGAGYFGPKTFSSAQKDLALLQITEAPKKEEPKEDIKEVEKVEGTVVEEEKALLSILDEEKDNYPLLSATEETDLKNISVLLGNLLDRKAEWNRIVLESLKDTVEWKLEDIMANISDNKGKQKIQFILDNM